MNLAVCADAAVLARLHAGAVDDPWTASDIAELLAGAGVIALAAEIDNGHAIGFILCRGVGEEAEILTLATLPAHRRKGAATALVRAAGVLLAKAGAASLFLEVAEDNAAARALYRREGFQEIGRRPAYYIRSTGAIDALVLRHDLNSAGAEPYA